MQIFSSFLNKIKNKADNAIGVGGKPPINLEALVTSLIIILVAFGSFGLGRLSKVGEEKQPLAVKQMEASVGNISKKTVLSPQKAGATISNPQGDGIPSTVPGGFIVASKTGKKYHFPWCAGAQQVKEENKVWFINEDDARAAGYTPAANCRGLSQ